LTISKSENLNFTVLTIFVKKIIMRIPWNWGTKLLIAMILFIGFMLVLVFLCIKSENDLVESDYYPKGLKYQDRINEIQNALPLKDQFWIEQKIDNLELHYPPIQADSTSLVFFRPSDQKRDVIVPFQPDSSGLLLFSSTQFIPGKYLMKIYWNDSRKGYYIERTFFYN
jgi:hypothetical protein